MPNEVLHLATTYADRYIWNNDIQLPDYESMCYGALWLAGDVLEPGTPFQSKLMKLLTLTGCKLTEETVSVSTLTAS